MSYRRCNISFPEALYREAIAYCEANHLTFSELVKICVRNEIHNGSTTSTPPLTQTPPKTIKSTNPRYYDDPVGLATRLNQFVKDHNLSNNMFEEKYGISIHHKAKWLRGRSMRHATAARLLEILDSEESIK